MKPELLWHAVHVCPSDLFGHINSSGAIGVFLSEVDQNAIRDFFLSMPPALGGIYHDPVMYHDDTDIPT
jgi:hypothetical protein